MCAVKVFKVVLHLPAHQVLLSLFVLASRRAAGQLHVPIACRQHGAALPSTAQGCTAPGTSSHGGCVGGCWGKRAAAGLACNDNFAVPSLHLQPAVALGPSESATVALCLTIFKGFFSCGFI